MDSDDIGNENFSKKSNEEVPTPEDFGDDDSDDDMMDPETVRLGWRLERHWLRTTHPRTGDTLRGQRVILYKVWTPSEVQQGDGKCGRRKKTWEVAAENSIPTYRIDENPDCADVVLELRRRQQAEIRKRVSTSLPAATAEI